MATLGGKDANPSQWLKASDIDYKSRIFHIVGASFEEVGEKKKVVLRLSGTDKGFVLNKTNEQLIEAILGSHQIEKWIGNAVELYTEKVVYGGRVYDALRVRAVPTGAAVEPLSAEPVGEESEIPF